MEIDVRQLARWQIEIYWLHDAERFDDLAATTANLFAALGHADGVSQAVGRCIGTAYQLADQAEHAFLSGSVTGEQDGYRQAGEILQDAASRLDLAPDVATSQVAWWHQFRHKNRLAVAHHILRQHIHHVSPSGIFLLPVIVATLLLIGRAHNRRDQAVAAAAARRYWTLLLRAYDRRRIPYLG
jgi:hypothetical protein